MISANDVISSAFNDNTLSNGDRRLLISQAREAYELHQVLIRGKITVISQKTQEIQTVISAKLESMKTSHTQIHEHESKLSALANKNQHAVDAILAKANLLVLHNSDELLKRNVLDLEALVSDIQMCLTNKAHSELAQKLSKVESRVSVIQGMHSKTKNTIEIDIILASKAALYEAILSEYTKIIQSIVDVVDSPRHEHLFFLAAHVIKLVSPESLRGPVNSIAKRTAEAVLLAHLKDRVICPQTLRRRIHQINQAIENDLKSRWIFSSGVNPPFSQLIFQAYAALIYDALEKYLLTSMEACSENMSRSHWDDIYREASKNAKILSQHSGIVYAYQKVFNGHIDAWKSYYDTRFREILANPSKKLVRPGSSAGDVLMYEKCAWIHKECKNIQDDMSKYNLAEMEVHFNAVLCRSIIKYVQNEIVPILQAFYHIYNPEIDGQISKIIQRTSPVPILVSSNNNDYSQTDLVFAFNSLSYLDEVTRNDVIYGYYSVAFSLVVLWLRSIPNSKNMILEDISPPHLDIIKGVISHLSNTSSTE